MVEVQKTKRILYFTLKNFHANPYIWSVISGIKTIDQCFFGVTN
jgi:hypothetical protein